MTDGPIREFGQRRPVTVQMVQPVKRSSHVALLLMGAFAVGGGAYALMPGENCGQRPGIGSDLQPGAQCPPRGSSSSGGRTSSSWHTNFFGGDSSSRPAAATSPDPASGRVTRGGFGGFAQAFASHFSRGG
jgi:hypothetical protein